MSSGCRRAGTRRGVSVAAARPLARVPAPASAGVGAPLRLGELGSGVATAAQGGGQHKRSKNKAAQRAHSWCHDTSSPRYPFTAYMPRHVPSIGFGSTGRPADRTRSAPRGTAQRRRPRRRPVKSPRRAGSSRPAQGSGHASPGRRLRVLRQEWVVTEAARHLGQAGKHLVHGHRTNSAE